MQGGQSLRQTRPIYHKCDQTIRSHVFCSFLALVLRQELQARLKERGHELEWADVISDLDRLQRVEVEQEGKQLSHQARHAGQTAGQFLHAESLVERRPAPRPADGRRHQ